MKIISSFPTRFVGCSILPTLSKLHFQRPTSIVRCPWRQMSKLNKGKDYNELIYAVECLATNPRSIEIALQFMKPLHDAAWPVPLHVDAKFKKDLFTYVMDGMEARYGPGAITWPPHSCYGLSLYTRRSNDTCLKTIHNATWEILQMSGTQPVLQAFSEFGWRWFPGRVALSLLEQAPRYMQIPDLEELADHAAAASKIWKVYPVAPEFWTTATSLGECWERGVSIVNLFPDNVSYADSEGHNSQHLGAEQFAAVLNHATATIPSDKPIVIIRPAKGEAFEGINAVKNATGDWNAAIECYQPLSDTAQLELNSSVSPEQPWKPVQHLTDALAGLQAAGTALSPVAAALSSLRCTYVRLTPDRLVPDLRLHRGILLQREATVAQFVGVKDLYAMLCGRWDKET